MRNFTHSTRQVYPISYFDPNLSSIFNLNSKLSILRNTSQIKYLYYFLLFILKYHIIQLFNYHIIKSITENKLNQIYIFFNF